MQPHQKAAQALRSGEDLPVEILKNIGLTAGTTGLGIGTTKVVSKGLEKLIPAIGSLINQYVPENISKAGLQKVDPRFGNFIKGAEKMGYSYDEIRNFLGDKVQQSQAQETKNIIEKESPELHQFIKEEIGKGRNALQAGALAQNDKRFTDTIKKLSKQHKLPWSQIVESIFGSQPNAQQNTSQSQAIPQQAQQNAPMQQQGLDPRLAQLIQTGNQLLQRYQGNQ